MPYAPNSTFVELPNGDLLDVANLVMGISGATLSFKNNAGVVAHQFTFNSEADAANYVSKLSFSLTSFKLGEIIFYDWSIDAMEWQFPPIMAQTSPIYLQFNGLGLSNADHAVLTDSAGTVFNFPSLTVTGNYVTAGPFSQAGQNTPAVGNGRFVLYDKNNIAIAATIINFVNGQFQPGPTISLVQWSSGSYQDLPVNVSPGGAISFQINGQNLPLNTEYVMINYTSTYVQIAVSATQITTGNFSLSLPAGTYDLQLQDIDNNVLADFGNVISVISS